MNIARNNYEEFFMLYADNELPAEQRKEVEAFIAANPDLQHELVLFCQFKVSPDATVVFNNKAALLKQEKAPVNITTTDYKSFFVLYADDELTNAEKAAVEDFVYRHPQLQEAFEMLQQVRLQADNNIVFENKDSLYRKEEDDRVIPFPWWRLAAAAAIILFVAGIFRMNREKKNDLVTVIKSLPVKPVDQPLLPATKDTATFDKHSKNVQPNGETVAATVPGKENPQVKNKQAAHALAVYREKAVKQGSDKLPAAQEPVIKEEMAAVKNDIKRTGISPVHKQPETVEVQTASVAAAKKPIVDQPAIILTPDEDNKNKAAFTSLNDDNVEVLNTSVNTKSSLRGFLRKASRLIAKKTNGNEDGNHKNILIGGFEIAVR